MRKDLEKFDLAHRMAVRELVDHGGYKKVRNADQYAEKVLASMWRPVIGIETDDEPLVDQLGFTSTMTLVLHLFGRAVHHHGMQRSKMPIIRNWRPVYDKNAQMLRFPRAISKRDIAAIIGRSVSAVDDAVGRFRGKTEKHEALFSKRVAHPLFVETGIMLDVMVHPNLSFSFMLDDYSYANRVAEDARINDAETIYRQRQWCSDAVKEMSPATTPHQSAEPGQQVAS